MKSEPILQDGVLYYSANLIQEMVRNESTPKAKQIKELCMKLPDPYHNFYCGFSTKLREAIRNKLIRRLTYNLSSSKTFYAVSEDDVITYLNKLVNMEIPTGHLLPKNVKLEEAEC